MRIRLSARRHNAAPRGQLDTLTPWRLDALARRHAGALALATTPRAPNVIETLGHKRNNARAH
eukprot:1076297-Lingulodinium_polyedra.AAC.1